MYLGDGRVYAMVQVGETTGLTGQVFTPPADQTKHPPLSPRFTVNAEIGQIHFLFSSTSVEMNARVCARDR